METELSLAENWNAYWTEQLSNKFDKRFAQIGLGADLLTDRLHLLRERNVSRILLPGNGCSLLPYALKHLGFEVIVADISSVANESVAQANVTPEMLGAFLPAYRKQRYENSGNAVLWDIKSSFRANIHRLERRFRTVNVWDEEASLQRVRREAKSGGSMMLITADIENWEPDAPVDAIYDDRAIMIMPQSDWTALAAGYYRWLNAGGIAIISTVNLSGDQRDLFDDAFRKAGFQEQEYRQNGRRMTLITPPNGKVVCFIHGSG